ncbi:hypothetical protein [Kitasatospora sp. NPDC017646]|uniref:hypothetical protein n=1 Tax=Kitasatospora sp. NPDC017646 TaxID=3364024 RepID=UPI0037B02BEF
MTVEGRSMITRVAHWSASHPWWALALWMAFVVGVLAVGTLLCAREASDADLSSRRSVRSARTGRTGRTSHPEPSCPPGQFSRPGRFSRATAPTRVRGWQERIAYDLPAGSPGRPRRDPLPRRSAAADVTRDLHDFPVIDSINRPQPTPNG